MVKIIVGGSGQSNAVGGGGSEGGDLTINNKVKVWTGTSWEVATPGVAPFYPTEPGKLPRNNVMWNCCKRLQEETGADIYFILSGLGSTPISAWAAPSGAQWVALDTAVKGALASPELAGATTLDYFLWFQGESDAGSSTYKTDFLNFRSAMIASGWLTETTPVICGETKGDGTPKQALIEIMNDPASYPWMNFASNADIDIVVNNPHPTGPGCVDFGRHRFYPAMIDTPRKYPKNYKLWHPTLVAATSQPTLTYDDQKTYGGSYFANGVATVWFRLTLKSISGGSGGLMIIGLPYLPSEYAPCRYASSNASVAVDVDGLVLDDPVPIILQTSVDGIKLLRPVPAGTLGLTPAKIDGTFSIRGCLTFAVDGD